MLNVMAQDTPPDAGDHYWQAVLARDSAMDGVFVYAVSSTGIYCRPSCPSRKPGRANVLFFPHAHDAQKAGYRACNRCRPESDSADDTRAELVKAVCRHIEDHLPSTLTLKELGEHFNMSPYHLQRTFKKHLGISPKAYTDACRLRAVKGALQEGDDISGALYDAGFGSASRLYSKADKIIGMTPGTYRQGGVATHIWYTTRPCSLGYVLVAATDRGICSVQLGDSVAELETSLQDEFNRATIGRDEAGLASWVTSVLEHLEGRHSELDLPLDLHATAFQHQVWEALQDIPYGETRSYRDIAESVGRPTATRAVARACATNKVAVVIPCHRVVRSDGDLGGYRWGVERKAKLLRKENEANMGS
ncbi:MAG: bifunctional DNA-binding transcriptional regulator/O6-methylguanine-DNA methyltransferase Ada [Trueperaceae bacterium]|nr:MAG: bifunctional DNA-binding transcriptional regulator/O6-methylguanine-DNA methyltransferase Ada [Trueperaceae bacterium]